MLDRAHPQLRRWTQGELQRFLEIRQEFFLDPMGSNRERFLDAATLLQRALFDWYVSTPGKFVGMLSLVTGAAASWSQLRQEERRTLLERRFALNNAAPDVPAVESSVSADQWQKIFGSLGLGLKEPGTFDRFLVQLDEETNPSLRINHRYVGELLPHDNMISYLSMMLATFLNENAIIGKASPCVTHMEQAAVSWLLALVGWDGGIVRAPQASTVPVQRLPTLPLPRNRHQRWELEEPTGSIVAGGTIANISALLMARSAVFDYLLGWSGAVQQLGPILAWQLIRDIWNFDRLIVLTSLGAHYSVKKAALQAGVAPANVIAIPGSDNPWILDGTALKFYLDKLDQAADQAVKDSDEYPARPLILAVVAIAGKTETGYVDQLEEIASTLDGRGTGRVSILPTFEAVYARLGQFQEHFEKAIGHLGLTIDGISSQNDDEAKSVSEAQQAAARLWEPSDATPETGENPSPATATVAARPGDRDFEQLRDRIRSGNEILHARHNRLFLHIDAAHGGGFLTVPQLRHGEFRGIEHADTITLDGHKSFYCYYPCGGILVRTTRWAQTFSLGHSSYISEEENLGVHREDEAFAAALVARSRARGTGKDQEASKDPLQGAGEAATYCSEADREHLQAVYGLIGRPTPALRSELTHLPYNTYLEGSRGPQGIMQLYFNLATLGLRGYERILGWTVLLRARTEEAISLGMHDVRSVTDPPLPGALRANDKPAAIWAGRAAGSRFDSLRPGGPATVVPVGSGRFLRLSAGACNQLLISYVPVREAKLIATASMDYWQVERVQVLMSYLWRVNEHLWNEHIYANPHFTYYVGHTTLDLVLPLTMGDKQPTPTLRAEPDRQKALARLLAGWNAWTRQSSEQEPGVWSPFLDQLTHGVAGGKHDGLKRYARRFFCHKIVTMHPYTDESLLGDMLRRMAFWGERSALAVRLADARAEFFSPL